MPNTRESQKFIFSNGDVSNAVDVTVSGGNMPNCFISYPSQRGAPVTIEHARPWKVAGTVVRVVGDDLVYVLTEALRPFVFTPDKIDGYKGQHLRKIGIREGSRVQVSSDATGHTILSVGENS